MCAADCGAHNQQVACRLSVTSDFAESCLRYERVELRLAPCLFTSFPLVEPAWLMFPLGLGDSLGREGHSVPLRYRKFWAHFSLTLSWGFDTVGLLRSPPHQSPIKVTGEATLPGGCLSFISTYIKLGIKKSRLVRSIFLGWHRGFSIGEYVLYAMGDFKFLG